MESVKIKYQEFNNSNHIINGILLISAVGFEQNESCSIILMEAFNYGCAFCTSKLKCSMTVGGKIRLKLLWILKVQDENKIKIVS